MFSAFPLRLRASAVSLLPFFRGLLGPVPSANASAALKTLDHADPYVRLWTARLLCDEKRVSPAVARKLTESKHQ